MREGSESRARRVLLTPASGEWGRRRPVFFLFTLGQVTEVLRPMPLLPVPFAPPGLPGLSLWREQVVPVIELEACLGVTGAGVGSAERYLAVQSQGRYGLVRSAPGIRILPMPEARPMALPPPLRMKPIRGLFATADALLVIPHLGAILSGAIPANTAESTMDEGEEGMTEPVILVVEDSPTNLRLITEALQADGYTILTAADGEEAIATTVRDRPSLLVLDVILPRKNGFQVCRQLRNMPETKNIPILMLTSKNQESDRFWGLRQGADEYMTKPYEMDDLRAAVHRLIQPVSGT